MILAALQFLLPGYAWILVSGLFKRFNFLERLVASFLLSIALTTVLSTALAMATDDYLLYSALLLLAPSAFIIVVFHLKSRPRLSWALGLDLRGSLPILLAVFVYSVMLGLLAWSAPFYPTADARDPVLHAQFVKTILSGAAKPFLSTADFPPGLHFAAAVLAYQLNVEPLPSLRILLSLVLLLILPLTYLAARATTHDPKIAVITMLIAGFAMPVDAIHLIRVGTFPSVLADAMLFGTLWMFFAYLENPSPSLGSTLAFVGLAGALTHSSFILFLCILWVLLPLLLISARQKMRRSLEATAYTTSGLIPLAIWAWPLLARNASRIFTLYVGDFTPVPQILQQTTWNFTTFVGPVNLVAIILATAYTTKNLRKMCWSIFTIGWLITLVAIAMLSSTDWRFVLVALLPGIFLVGNALGSQHSPSSSAYTSRLRKILGARRAFTTFALLALILSGGFLGLLPRIYDPDGRALQEDVRESMMWLMAHDSEARVASVGLWHDYRYLPVLTGMSYAGDFDASAGVVLQSSIDGRINYFVVSSRSDHLQSFEVNDHFQEEFRNGSVAIFLVKST